MKKKSLVIGLVIFFLDQLIKIIINKSFYYGFLKTIVPNFIYLTKVYNKGAAWSTFMGARLFLIVVSLLAFVFIWGYQKKFKNSKRNALTFGLIYGGLLGNLWDRITLGYVIDYIKVNLGSYNFPIFNLADMTIVGGFLLLMYALFKGEDSYGNKSK